MKKLTLVLLALLLVVTCVFAASCKKKNNDTQPADNTGDKTPVVETFTTEQKNQIAEAFKADFAANNKALYSGAVAEEINTAKSAALAGIYAAATKADAEAIAKDCIEFLKAQKTTLDLLKELVDKIAATLTLDDEDAVKQAAAYKAVLDAAADDGIAAKKAVLDAYKADTNLQKTVAQLSARINQLKAATFYANAKIGDLDTIKNDGTKVAADGVNVLIKAQEKAFADKLEAKEEFKLGDFGDFDALVKAIAKFAEDYDLAADSAAYKAIVDGTTLAAAEKYLTDAKAADKVLVAMLAVVDAEKALDAAAEAARYKEYCYIDKTAAAPAVEYDTEAAAIEANVKAENVVKAESNSTASLKAYALKKADYKLTLKADVEAAKKVVTDLFKYYNATELATKYDYGKGSDVVKPAVDSIAAIEAAYKASVTRAAANYPALFSALYLDKAAAKDATVGSYAIAFTAKSDVDKNQTAINTDIDNAVKSFKTLNDDNKPILSASGMYLEQGNYYTKDYQYDFVSSKPTIYFTAWTYSYQLEKAGDLATASVFNAKTTLNAATLAQAKDAIEWLTVYIGEGNYAKSYDLGAYADYDTGKVFVKDFTLTLDDRAVTEVAKAGVVQINGAAVETKQSDKLAVKVLNPYDVAKALIAEDEKIAAAKKEAVESIQAAVLALRTAGTANAIIAADDLYKAIENGSYLNNKLYGKNTTDAILAQSLAAVKVEVKAESKKGAGDAVQVLVSKMLGDAKAVLATANSLASASTVVTVDKTTQTLSAFYAAVTAAKANATTLGNRLEEYGKYVARAQELLNIAKTGETAKIVKEKTDAYNLTSEAAQANYNNAQQLEGLFADKDTFDSAYGTATYLGDKSAADVKKFIEKFAPVDATAAKITALATYIAGITSTTDSEDLAKVVKTAEETFEAAVKEFDKLEGMTAKTAWDDVAKIDAVIKALTDFATAYNADYLNLKASATYGTKTVEFDFLSDVYNGKLLSNAYAPIGKILANYGTAKVGGDKWEDSVTNLVEESTSATATVTSFKTADKALKDQKLVKANYKLETAATLLGVTVDDILKVTGNVGE